MLFRNGTQHPTPKPQSIDRLSDNTVDAFNYTSARYMFNATKSANYFSAKTPSFFCDDEILFIVKQSVLVEAIFCMKFVSAVV